MRRERCFVGPVVLIPESMNYFFGECLLIQRQEGWICNPVSNDMLSGFDGLGLPNGQFLSSTGSLVFGKQADLCQVRWALDNKFLRVNGFTISPEHNLMSS